jgi:biopolymer transport protein ExbB
MVLEVLTALTIAALAMLSPLSPSLAQQNGAPAVQQGPVVSQPAGAPFAPAPAATDPTAPSADGGARPLKSTVAGLRELSPWSMFLSADILVKAVLTLAQRRLRADLARIGSAKSMAEALFALGAKDSVKDSVLSSLLGAAMREARLSAGISSDAGVKERAASSFAEIVRTEARRIRLGMGLLATIGATSPFVGLFGTVWGIMNSFIGISKSQTTNLAVVAPGIAEALLATAFGLAAAIPAVIIYNHFTRVTKAYLELVGRSSGAAARLLSRDLDRSHGAAHPRAAE